MDTVDGNHIRCAHIIWQLVAATVDSLAPPLPTPSGIECPRGWNWELAEGQ
jgi:hypothetical protein